MFRSYTAAEYRALDNDAFSARCDEVSSLIESGELPEGVTIETLSAELDMIKAERNLRSLAEADRQARAAAVATGAGRIIATDEPEKRELPKDEVAPTKHEIRDVTDLRGFSDSIEYRRALANHVLRKVPMPRDLLQKALQERADAIAVDFPETFSNMTDPTFNNTITSLIVVPTTLSEEVQKEMRETSVLYPKVNITTYQGQLAVSEYDLQVQGMWIGDKEVSPYQGDYDPEIFTWGWHQFEVRFARTFLAQALMTNTYVSQLAPAIAECIANEWDFVTYKGDGVTQPRGIINDLRLLGPDGKGFVDKDQPFYTQRTGTGQGRALVVEVTEEQIDDWKFWSTILYNPLFNRLYRGRGELIIADGTWGNHVNVLHDDNNRPITLMNPLVQEERLTLRGVGPVDTLPNHIMPDFDSAEVGDIIGIYGNMKNYTMNIQPGMTLSTVSWDDHETNTHKTKVLTAMDGRVSNPFGWVIFKKGPSA